MGGKHLDLLDRPLEAVKRASEVDVLLPSRLTAEHRQPTNTRRVTLAGRRRGYFKPLTCGASCAAASLEWVQDGVLYTIEAKLGTRRTERSILIGLANSAIRSGPR